MGFDINEQPNKEIDTNTESEQQVVNKPSSQSLINQADKNAENKKNINIKKIKDADKIQEKQKKFISGIGGQIKTNANQIQTPPVQPTPQTTPQTAPKENETPIDDAIKSLREDAKQKLEKAKDVIKGIGDFWEKKKPFGKWMKNANLTGIKNVPNYFSIGKEYNLNEKFVIGLVANVLHESSGDPSTQSKTDTFKGVPQSFGLIQWQKGRLLELLKRHFADTDSIKNFIAKRKQNSSIPVTESEAKDIVNALKGPNSIRKQMAFIIEEINQYGTNPVSREISGINKFALKEYKKLFDNPSTTTEQWSKWITQYYIRPKDKNAPNYRSETALDLEKYINSLKPNEGKKQKNEK